MGPKVDIWMPLAIGDYLADTSHLDTTQHGAYLLLLMHYWRKGPLPNDANQLANIAKLSKEDWNVNQAVLLEFFNVGEDGLLHQKRQDVERAKAMTQRSRGVAGANAKWGIEGADAEERTKLSRSQRLAEARRKGTHTEEEWLQLQAFCRHQCVRCQASENALVKDHIVPLYQGGSDAIENIQPVCRKCSASRGPENTDYRPDGWQNACKTPAKMHGKTVQNAWTSPLPSPIPLPTPLPLLPGGAKNAPPSSNGGPSDALGPDSGPSEDFEFDDAEEPAQGLFGDSAEKRTAMAKAVKEVFAYYLAAVERNPATYTLTRQRKQKGAARLAEALRIAHGNLPNAVELMKAVVDELAASDWHMGRNERTNGKRYCDWENHLFRNAEQFEKWLQQAQEAGAREKAHA